MRRAAIVLSIFVLILTIFFLAEDRLPVLAQQRSSGDEPVRASVRSRENDKKMAEVIRQLTDRSSDGLVEQTLHDGTVFFDLDGRFQNVMLGRVDSNGEAAAACVTSLAEANDFFGRDLETGRPVPSLSFLREDISNIARRHGMGVDEYLFYTKMISDAAVNEALASPSSAVITIVNNNGPGVGFNDTQAAFVVGEGGNAGTTRGEQRLNVFNFAAAIWGAFLDSSVPINVQAQFAPQTCSTSGGVLGSAGSVNVVRDFSGAEFAGTWYSSALANKRAGVDLIPANPEINATFNLDLDESPTCFGPNWRFYYGLDNATPSQRINLLVVLLHEMGHGLGFQSFVNGSTGAFFSGFPDVYLRNMYDRSVSLSWHQMSNAQRQASAINVNNVLWDGPNVRLASGFLTNGRDATTGRVELFTPSPLQSGSSISHFGTAAFPNLLMEPSITSGLPLTLDLSRQLMRDIGWYRDTTGDNIPDTITGVVINDDVAIIDDTVEISWTNSGGFNRNVTIELSTDGGATFSTVLAADLLNTGNFTWNVPNTPTTQARIRVREIGFIQPSGISSANFVISLAPSSAPVTVSGRVVDLFGRGIGNVHLRIDNGHGRTSTVRTNPFGYYQFSGLSAGTGYVLSPSHKQYRFSPINLLLNDNMTDVNFSPMP
ncbi:MAG: carboxypeptidase regulatory-like domain-containing protein [Acidobacteria bacterium]|nr:carboxypeptidase regulatory-like domain-containing protein [Acidobacteriota bacterium]